MQWNISRKYLGYLHLYCFYCLLQVLHTLADGLSENNKIITDMAWS